MRNRRLSILVCIAAVAGATLCATAESSPEWFRDAKFGIFIHWGVYSVAGCGMREIASVSLLGSSAPLTFHQQPDGLRIQGPAEPTGQYAYAYRITWR